MCPALSSCSYTGCLSSRIQSPRVMSLSLAFLDYFIIFPCVNFLSHFLDVNFSEHFCPEHKHVFLTTVATKAAGKKKDIDFNWRRWSSTMGGGTVHCCIIHVIDGLAVELICSLNGLVKCKMKLKWNLFVNKWTINYSGSFFSIIF